MADTSDFKNGLCIEFNNDLYSIVQFQHVKPGKGAAFVRTKLKSLTNGRVIENTFNSGVKVNVVRIERRPHQFLYKDENGYNFMHTETFEQVSIDEKLVENPQLYKEGQYAEIVFHAENEMPLSCELPPFVELEVVYTEPGLKGDTSSSTSLKAAKLETGATVMVPLFVNMGEIIRIDTRDCSYSERVRSK